MRAEQDVVVGRVRRQGWARVGHGLYRREATADERWADLLAWQQVLPTSGCLTHLTAAALHGLWLPPLPDDLPVFVSQSRSETRPKRAELKVMRHTRGIDATRRRGLLVADPHEVLLVCARHLSLLDLVVLGDSALHLGLTSPGELTDSASRPRWGAAALRRAVGWMDPRSESPWESLLRVLHRACGIVVVPQHEVRDPEGRFVARGDLLLAGTRVLHEYDGAVHRARAAHAEDLRRDRALLRAGWVRRGYTAADVLGRPDQILRDADESVGRAHRADRLDPWVRLVEESLWSTTGQQRFAARLGDPGSGRERPPEHA